MRWLNWMSARFRLRGSGFDSCRRAMLNSICFKNFFVSVLVFLYSVKLFRGSKGDISSIGFPNLVFGIIF